MASRAWSTRRTLWAASRASASSPFGVAIERRAPGEQVADVAGAFFTQHPHGALVAQAVAGRQRVLGVQLRRVVAADRGRDAALRVAGIPLRRPRLGQDDDVARLGELDRRAQRRDPASHDQIVALQVHGYVRLS